MSSSDFDTWREQFESRANKITEDHAAEIRALFAQSGLLHESPPEQIDLAALRAEAAQFDQSIAQTVDQVTAPLPPKTRLGWRAALSECDALMIAAFTSGQRKLSNKPLSPLITVNTISQWAQAIGRGLNLTSKEIDVLRDREQSSASPAVILHVPGAGTVINVGALAQRAEHDYPHDESQQYALALRALVAERWGRRLITDDTVLGDELLHAGTWTRQLRQQLGIDLLLPEDSSDAVLAVSALVMAGWPRWVRRYAFDYARIEDTMLASPRIGPQGLVEVLDNLGEALKETLRNEAQTLMAWVMFALKTLLLVRGPRWAFAQPAIRAIRKLRPGLDATFGAAFNRSFGDWLAEALFARLDVAVGPDNVPYAVMMACGMNYDVKSSTFGQTTQRINADPELDVDLRLALLAGLKNMRHRSVRDIARAARNDLGMTVPAELFEID